MRTTRAARRDPNEREIIDALQHRNVAVLQVDAADLPDLLVVHEGRWVWLEVKRPPGPRGGTSEDGQKLSAGQAEFFALAAIHRAPAYVVWSARDALVALGLDTPTDDERRRYGLHDTHTTGEPT